MFNRKLVSANFTFRAIFLDNPTVCPSRHETGDMARGSKVLYSEYFLVSRLVRLKFGYGEEHPSENFLNAHKQKLTGKNDIIKGTHPTDVLRWLR